jgi:hypothetical protein
MVTEMLPVVPATIGAGSSSKDAVAALLVVFVFFGAAADPFFLASVFLAFTGFGADASFGSSSFVAGALALAVLLRVVRPIVARV